MKTATGCIWFSIEMLVTAHWVMLGLNLVLCTVNLDRFSKPFVQVQMG